MEIPPGRDAMGTRVRLALDLILENPTVSSDLGSQPENRYQSGRSELHRGEKPSNEGK